MQHESTFYRFERKAEDGQNYIYDLAYDVNKDSVTLLLDKKFKKNGSELNEIKIKSFFAEPVFSILDEVQTALEELGVNCRPDTGKALGAGVVGYLQVDMPITKTALEEKMDQAFVNSGAKTITTAHETVSFAEKLNAQNAQQMRKITSVLEKHFSDAPIDVIKQAATELNNLQKEQK